MKSLKRGRDISSASVENITPFGIWVLAGGEEYFLSYNDFPMFLDRSIKSILNVSRPHPGHLRWPDMDIDIEVDSIREPEKYPLLDRFAR